MFFYIYTALLFIEFRKYKSLFISIWVIYILLIVSKRDNNLQKYLTNR